jgi:hypothetical protein
MHSLTSGGFLAGFLSSRRATLRRCRTRGRPGPRWGRVLVRGEAGLPRRLRSRGSARRCRPHTSGAAPSTCAPCARGGREVLAHDGVEHGVVRPARDLFGGRPGDRGRRAPLQRAAHERHVHTSDRQGMDGHLARRVAGPLSRPLHGRRARNRGRRRDARAAGERGAASRSGALRPSSRLAPAGRATRQLTMEGRGQSHAPAGEGRLAFGDRC